MRRVVRITSRDPRETLGSVDRAPIIWNGSIYRHGTAIELAADPKVRAVYLGERFALPEKGGGGPEDARRPAAAGTSSGDPETSEAAGAR